MQWCRSIVRVAQRIGHPAPELACSAELRDGHELVVVGGQLKADLVQCIGHGHSGTGLQSQIIGCRADHSGQFPCGVGADVMEGVPVQHD